jgi:TonB-linked SusC/RagA family outer membrane protein
MKRRFTHLRAVLTLIAMLAICMANAQTRKVSGTVSSADDHKPLPGVTVLVKGTTVGTQSNANGNFTLNVTDKDALVFRMLGFEELTVPVAGKTNIEVSLKPENKSLNEVLVVGYSTQSRATVTSSVSKLDNQVLATAPRANVASALQGSISGLQVISGSGTPGSNPLITLRGGASISAPAQPLIVVDGIIRAYNDIPEEDIASVDVLKDAAATAIYGARASNGVILITTKKGKAGTAQIDYKFTTGFNENRQGYQFLDARDYIYYARLGGVNAGRSLSAINNSRGYGLLTDPADLASFDIREETPQNINLLQQGWQDMDDPANPGTKIIFKDHSKQIQDMVFRNTQTVDHYLSASGGTDKGTYFASLDYYNEPGVIIGSTYDRYSGNFNGSLKVKPNVEVTSGVTFSTSSQLGTVNGSDVNTMYRTLSLWPTFNPWLDAAQTQPNPGNGISDGNPLYWLQHQKNTDEVDRITAKAVVKWDILPGLTFKLSGSGYLFQELDNYFQYATQLYSNLFANPPSYSNTTRPAYAAYQRTFEQTYDATLNYTKSYGKHNFNLLVGGEYFDNALFNDEVYGTNAPTDNITTVNASTVFPAGNNTSAEYEYRIISSFGTLNYNYDEKYLVNLVLREDGVSQLAPQKRIGFFPGVSVGWNLSKEDFFQNSAISKVISTIKPRISYGSNGNISPLSQTGNLYITQGAYSTTTPYNTNGAIYNSTPTNPNLSWETSTTKDVGIDLGLFHDRISLLVDYYDKINGNLLTTLPLPNYMGFGSIYTNDGTYQNKGLELTLNAHIINNPNGLKLDFGAIASYNKNKVLKLPYNGNANNRQGGVQVFNPKTGQLQWVAGIQEGQPLGQVYGYKELGIFSSQAQIQSVAGSRVDNIAGITGPSLAPGPGGHITPGDVNWEDVNHDGIIDSRDQVYLGNIFPTWTGGFNMSAAYKSFSFYTRFDYSLGSIIYNDFVARSLGQYQGTFNMISEMKNSWTPTNTNTMIPKDYYADQVLGSKDNYTRGNNASANLLGENSQLYESGNYLACREVTLSYDFPKSWIRKTHVFTRAKIYVSGDNLFYIKKFSGPDPEAPVSGNTITGVYQGTYPTPRTYVLGVQVSL